MERAIKHSDEHFALLTKFCGLTKQDLASFLEDGANLLGPSSPVNPDVFISPRARQTATTAIPNPPTPTNSSTRNPIKRSATQLLLEEFTLDDGIETVRTEVVLDDCERRIKRFCSHLREPSASPSRLSQPPADALLKHSSSAIKAEPEPLRASPKPDPTPARRTSRRCRSGVASASKDAQAESVPERKAEHARVRLRHRSASRDLASERRRSESRNRARRSAETEEKNSSAARPAKARKTKGHSRAQAAGENNGSVPKRSRRPRSTKEEDSLIADPKSGAAGPSGLSARDSGAPIPSDIVVEAEHIPDSCEVKDTDPDKGKRTKAASHKTSPRAWILDFAKGGTNSLAKLDKLKGEARLKKRCSLATFEGCEKLERVSVASYFRALCVSHKKAVAFATVGDDDVNGDRGIDELVCKVDAEDFAREMTTGEERMANSCKNLGPVAPFLERTMDVLQLIFRLWQKMSTADQDTTIGFMESLYEQGAVCAIAELATGVLKIWQKKSASVEHERTRSELVEFAIRMLANIFSFELSPVSIIPESIKLSDMGIQEKDENFSLTQLMDVVLDYVGHDAVAGRECRVAASDMCHIYISRHHFGFPREGENGEAWEKIFKSNGGHVQSVIQHRAFWPIVANTAIQTVRKSQGRDNNSKVAVAFLVSLLSEPAASRSLLESQTKVRHGLLRVFVTILDRMGKKLVSCFREAEYERISHPELPSVLDLVRRLMSFAVVQREVVSSSELGGRKMFLEAIENVISSAAKLVQGTMDTAELVAAAESRGLGKLGDDLQRVLSVPSNGRGASQGGTESESEAPETAKLTAMAVHRSLAFAAWLIGSLGKSMEDGSRDISQMNGLQVLLSSKYSSTRNVRKLWIDVIKIQTCVEEKIPISVQEIGGSMEMPDLSQEVLLSAQDRNHFSMVVEGIRQRLASDMKERRARSSPWSQKQSSHVNRANFASDTKSEAKFSFPTASKLKELRAAVCLPKGYLNLDDDPQMLAHLEKVMRAEGEDVLSRYDVDSDIMYQWVRLQKKNAYVENARELLDKVDRTLGHPCSCLPGNPTESGNGNQNHIACSNDLCENRSTKVECVPGECGAGSYCQNQRLQRQEYARVKIQSFPKKGLGVVANEDIPAGKFIGEYQGEVISKETFEKRRKMYRGEKHFYFMTLTGKLVIDASRKSQFTRFVNHCCEPNAETQKWNAGGEPRVGIFAKRQILKGEEITFDYGASSLDNDSVPCLCGAGNCKGTLTSKGRNDKEADVPFDEAGLANPESSPKKDAMSAEKRREAENEELEQLQATIKEKIEKAKKRLNLAAELKSRKSEAKQKHRPQDESFLSEQMKSRLAEWESSLGKKKEKTKSIFSLNNDSSSKPEARVRIPRRPPQSILITHAAHLRKKEKEEMASRLNRASQKRPVTSALRRPEHPQAWYQRFGNNTSRMNAPQGSATVPERAGTQATVTASKPDTKNAPQVPKKAIPVFAPTSTKFKRPRLKPKTAERTRKKKRDDDDSDSMDGYSTASSVEPIMEEPEHSDIPEGLGACSDDEFVAAPPIVPEPENRDSVWRDGSHRDPGHGPARERRDNEERGQRHALRGAHQGTHEGHRSPRFRDDYRSGPRTASRTGNGAYDRYGHDTRRRSTPPQDRFYRNHGRSDIEGAEGSLLRHSRNMNRPGYVTERGRDLSHQSNQELERRRVMRNESVRNDPSRDMDYPKAPPPNPDLRQTHTDMEGTARVHSKGNPRAEMERDNPFRKNRGNLRDLAPRVFHQERGNWSSTANAEPVRSHTGPPSGRNVESRTSYSVHQERGNRIRMGNVGPELPHMTAERRNVTRHQAASSTHPPTDKDVPQGNRQGLPGRNPDDANGAAPSGPTRKKDADRHDAKKNQAERAHQGDQRSEEGLENVRNHHVHEMEPNSPSRNAIPTRSGLQGNVGQMHNVASHVRKELLEDNRRERLQRQSASNRDAGGPLPIATSRKDENREKQGVAEMRLEGNAEYHSGCDDTEGVGKREVTDVSISKEGKHVRQSSLSNDLQTRILREEVKQGLAESDRGQAAQGKPTLAPQQETGDLKSIPRLDSKGIERRPGSTLATANATTSSDIGRSSQEDSHLHAAPSTKVRASHQIERTGFGDEKRKDVPSQGHSLVGSGRQERSGSIVNRTGTYTSRFEKRVDTEESGSKRARHDNGWSQGWGRRPQGRDEQLDGSGVRHGPGQERAPGRGSGVLDRVGRRPTESLEFDARPQLDGLRRSGTGGVHGRSWPAEQGGNLRRMPFRGSRWSPRWDGRREKRSPHYDGGGYGRYPRVSDVHPQGRMSGEAGGMDRRVTTERLAGPVGQRGQEQRGGQDGERSGNDLRKLIRKRSRP